MEEKKHHAMTPTWNGTVIQSIQFPNSWAAAAAYDRSRQLNANQAQSLADSYEAYSVICGGTDELKPRPADLTGRGIKETNETN